MERKQTEASPGTEEACATRAVRGVFHREGEYWTIDYGGTICRLRDATGLRHLAHLLARPGEKVAATELIRGGRRRGEKRSGGRAPTDPAVATAIAATQRARVRVTRTIRAAMRRIAAHNPPLGEHLTATIRTGVYCAYVPDRRISPGWEL